MRTSIFSAQCLGCPIYPPYIEREIKGARARARGRTDGRERARASTHTREGARIGNPWANEPLGQSGFWSLYSSSREVSL